MFKNYLTIALRNFWRHKVFSIINISGLSIGIAASLVIFMMVSYEFGFDKFEKDRSRIYRVTSDLHFPDQLLQFSAVPVPLATAAKRELPGIDIVAPFFLYPDKVHVTITANNKPVIFKQQPNVVIADDSYFNIISYQWIAGSPAVLKEPFKVVLTESRAKIYFPGSDITKAIGKTITYNDSIQVTVAGIVKDIPEATDFTFKEFISYSTAENPGLRNHLNFDDWTNISYTSQLLLKLKKGTDTAHFQKELKDLYKRNSKNDFFSITNKLQPLSDLHFSTDYDSYDQRKGHKPTLYGLLVLAAFLLLLGCINFINLTTAQAAQRAKEIGIRKTMGSSRRELVIQFLSETFMLTIIATILALFFVPLLLKLFSNYIPPEITFDMVKQPGVILFGIGLVISVSILSGLYPAFVLSKYNPSLVLKNQAFSNTGKTRNAWLRKTLTVSQFVIAQFLIIATIIVVKQISYSLNADMGFKKEAIITFTCEPGSDTPPFNKRFVLQQKLKAIPGIEMISLAGATPAVRGYNMATMKFQGNKKEIETTVEINNADTNYFKVFGLKLLAGRYLQQSDTTKEFLINNTYAKFLGYNDPEKIIGKFIERGNAKIPIVGVLADFHSQSMHNSIKPMAYSSAEKDHFNFHIALKKISDGTNAWKETIAAIEKAYKETYPEEASFNYEFVDERIARFYQAEQNLSKLLTWATSIAIFISCLGLLGLVIYTTGIRTKEIGVRKILGASVSQIVSLLSKDFLQLVMLAIIISAPAAWWVMNKWLQDFVYRTAISWWVFLLSGGLMIIIALLTLSIQTIRSATANPVKSLRTE